MTMHSGGATTSSPESRHPRVRSALLALHRALIEHERRDYERLHGRVSAGTFLHALVSEPQLAWLRPFTALSAELDQDEVPGAWHSQSQRLRELLQLDGESRYSQLFERSPDVAYTHAATLHALR